MLELKNISKQLGSFKLNDVSFSVEKGDYFMLMGMSGAGKTVLLETIAGLVLPDSGKILYNSKDITNSKIQKRNIPIVFQNDAVFPHLTVFQNIAYPLHGKKLSKAEINERVSELAKICSVSDFLSRKPQNLSGGELQRVALARALALEPELLLLDEPLSSLDTLLRADLRSLLRKINKLGTTIIHVTHDYNEATMLASKVGVLESGAIQQMGTPEEIFLYPQSEFVASFVGVNNFFGFENVSKNLIKIKNSEISLISNDNSGDAKFIAIDSKAIQYFEETPEPDKMNTFNAKVVEIISSHEFTKLVLDIGIKITADLDSDSFFVKNRDEVWVYIKPESIRYIENHCKP